MQKKAPVRELFRILSALCAGKLSLNELYKLDNRNRAGGKRKSDGVFKSVMYESECSRKAHKLPWSSTQGLQLLPR